LVTLLVGICGNNYFFLAGFFLAFFFVAMAISFRS
jgi:hypothetical protein